MSAADEHADRCAKLYARSSIEWLEESIRYHTRLLTHGKATPVSIARHQADIAELHGAIEQRKSVRTITSRSPARREDDLLEIAMLLEDERKRMYPGRLLKVVTATRGANRTPKPNLRREASYAMARREIRSVK